MKITKEVMEKECAKLENLLPYIDFKAFVETDEKGTPYIGVVDMQGANLGEIENDRFYSARSVLERCSHYFEDTFLNGEICCNADIDFESFGDAEEYARSHGYMIEANSIRMLIDVLNDPEPYQYKNSWYLFTEEELDAAYGIKQHMYRTEDAYRQIERLIYGDDDPESEAYDGTAEEEFINYWGFTPDILLNSAEYVASQFLLRQDCNIDENTMFENIILDTARIISQNPKNCECGLKPKW